MSALGLVETKGYASAVIAADFALKAANVTLVRLETVIGVAKSLGVTIFLTGEVAAVTAAIEAATEAIKPLGTMVSKQIIPNLDSKVRTNLFQNEF